MSTFALNPAPFTELRLTIANKKDKTYMNKIVSYLTDEAFKNEELPYMPREMWDYILTFIPTTYRTDAFVILGLVHRATYVTTYVDHYTRSTYLDSIDQYNRSTYLDSISIDRYSIGVCSVDSYINEYGKDQFDSIKTLSFNSLRYDIIMAKAIRYTNLQQVLNMDDATKTELIKILDTMTQSNSHTKNRIDLTNILMNISGN